MLSICIDGVVIPVANNRPRFGATTRTKPRTFQFTMIEAEKELLGKISKRSFIPELCHAYQYLKRTFGTEITYNMVRPLAHFFAHVLNFQLTREYYRRRKTLIFWLNSHYLAIRAYTGIHQIKVQYKNNTYNLE